MRVCIVGIGGLRHFGLLFAKALGADMVVAMSRTNGKREDALKLRVVMSMSRLTRVRIGRRSMRIRLV